MKKNVMMMAAMGIALCAASCSTKQANNENNAEAPAQETAAVEEAPAAAAEASKLDINGEWKVASIANFDIPSGVDVKLTISGDTAYAATAGANTVFGPITLGEKSINFGESGMTRMMGSPAAMAVEEVLAKTFLGDMGVEQNENTLSLKKGDKVILTLTK
ncbi:MAG: META domain-containing protein [Bacteroidales bacterium]|nr:META domain-containing protein [Bacteroidales bacterium]